MFKYPVFIVGCGDIGRRVAALHCARGDAVRALARTPASARRLTALGITPLAGDLDDAASLRETLKRSSMTFSETKSKKHGFCFSSFFNRLTRLKNGSTSLCRKEPLLLQRFLGRLSLHGAWVYYFAPPPEGSEHDPRIECFLASLDDTPAKLVYISTSGVYGDHQGGWVTEDTPPNPQTARAKARLAAESALLDWSRRTQAPAVILRVGGIYGPGRLPIERIRRAEPVVRREEAPYTNRIHADDLARVCVAAMERGAPGGIYNVCDGEHGAMTDYFNAVADALSLPHPPQISLAEAQTKFGPGMLSYLNESRRMVNRRMREELGVTLLYPTLEQGLKACAADTSPG